MKNPPKPKARSIGGKLAVAGTSHIDTSDCPRVPFRPLDIRNGAYSHLDSSRWRRGGRSLVTMTTRVGYHDKDAAR